MKQRGNILFLILLAVVLFAALAYAVTSSMRGGGKDAGAENVKAQAADMMGYFSQIDAALMRMQMSSDIKPQNISLVYDIPRYQAATTVNYANNTNCTVNACKLFHTEGGGVPLRVFDKYSTKDLSNWVAGYEAPGAMVFIMLQWPGAGTSANDVVLRVAAVSNALCQEINASLGISAIPTLVGGYVVAAPVSNWDSAAYTVSANASALMGKSTFGQCLVGSTHSHIYHLLIER